MNKKGMTLIELMVYMILAALLLAPVIFLMHNSSVNMARDAKNTDLRMSGRDILNILYEDIRNMGYKLNPDKFSCEPRATYLNINFDPDPSVGEDSAVIIYSVAWAVEDPSDPDSDPLPLVRDGSSFKAVNGGAGLYDALTFIKGKLDANAWVGTDTVTYHIEDQTTTRRLVRISSGVSGSTNQTLARNVEALQFQYVDDLENDWMDEFDETPGTDGLEEKMAVKFVKVSIVLKDDRELAAARTSEIPVGDTKITLSGNDQLALYERHDIVIPVPNNGLYPPMDIPPECESTCTPDCAATGAPTPCFQCAPECFPSP